MIYLFLIILSFILGVLCGLKIKVDPIYIITRHTGLVNEIIGITFTKKYSLILAKKIRKIENKVNKICVTKYKTLTYLTPRKKLSKEFIESI